MPEVHASLAHFYDHVVEAAAARTHFERVEVVVDAVEDEDDFEGFLEVCEDDVEVVEVAEGFRGQRGGGVEAVRRA